MGRVTTTTKSQVPNVAPLTLAAMETRASPSLSQRKTKVKQNKSRQATLKYTYRKHANATPCASKRHADQQYQRAVARKQFLYGLLQLVSSAATLISNGLFSGSFYGIFYENVNKPFNGMCHVETTRCTYSQNVNRKQNCDAACDDLIQLLRTKQISSFLATHGPRHNTKLATDPS